MTAKAYVYNLLNSNSTITDLLTVDEDGDPAIFQSWYDEIVGTPQITIMRIDEINQMDYDDTESIIVTPMQIDIWTDKGTSTLDIETQVRSVFLAQGIKTKAKDMHEETLNRVSITFEIDGSQI